MTPVEEISNVVHSVFPDWQVYFYAIPEEVIDNKNVTQVLITESNSDITTYGDNTFGADVKIMDRFFRHREVPDSEKFSKPGFQPKMA